MSETRFDPNDPNRSDLRSRPSAPKLANRLGNVLEASAATKPRDADQLWTELSAYFHDKAQDLTRRTLRSLGVGLRDNRRPVEPGVMLGRIVRRTAVMYDRPPSRWLTNAQGKRLSESSPDHRAMLDALRRAQYDLAWKTVDRLRALHRQVAIRFYPSDHRRGVVVRVFEPQHVHRWVDPACADLMDHDQAFALELAADTFEVWWRDDLGQWRMQWTDKNGAALPSPMQPFGPEQLGRLAVLERRGDGEREQRPLGDATSIPAGFEPAFVSPYEELPAQMIYESYPAGRPWLDPPQSRSGWIAMLSAIANDLWAMVTHQAHDKKVYKRRNPNNQLPEADGPSTTWNIDTEDEVELLHSDPKISESKEVLDRIAELWTLTEDLPVHELNAKPGEIVTGAALRVQMEPLQSRREDQVPLAQDDEREAWRRFRAVHNVHSAAWRVNELRPGLEMEVEIPDLAIPTTETERGNLVTRQLTIGTTSVIDVIMQERQCTREQAIKHFERVQADFEAYPPRVVPKESGPQNTQPPTNTPNNSPDFVRDGRASRMDAIRDVN